MFKNNLDVYELFLWSLYVNSTVAVEDIGNIVAFHRKSTG